MSVNYNVLGLIFASMHDSYVSELTKQRTMGSIPFGGRYRLIDFPLSNMVNSSVSEVGVITKSNYGSLLDHLGSGRDWDLSRKKGGVVFVEFKDRSAAILFAVVIALAVYQSNISSRLHMLIEHGIEVDSCYYIAVCHDHILGS